MNNEPVAWMIQYKDRHKFVFEKPTYSEHILACEPLYTHQYERPHNTVLVPCDKLAEMQAEIEALKKSCLDEIFKRVYAERSVEVVSELYTHPAKELTREDRLKLIGTLKWAEDLLREAGHDEAVSDVQDCIILLRKASEK